MSVGATVPNFLAIGQPDADMAIFRFQNDGYDDGYPPFWIINNSKY